MSRQRKWWATPDGAVHAFAYPLPNGRNYLATAACGTEAPKHRLQKPYREQRCLTCKLVTERHGDEIVEHSGGMVIDVPRRLRHRLRRRDR